MKKRQGLILVLVGILAGLLMAGPIASAVEELQVQRSAQPVYVDGRQVELTAYNINGSNYVKLRDVGEAVGFNVYYDEAEGSVQVERGKPYTGEAPGMSAAQQYASGDIGQEAAIDAALKDAGLTRDQITLVKAKKDYERGRLVYEIEFYSGKVEYEYDVDAATGEIVKVSREGGAGSSGGTSGDIGQDAAIEKALMHAGYTRSQVSGLLAKQDYEHGTLVYEIEFYVGMIEFEYEVNAATGEILKWDKDYRD